MAEEPKSSGRFSMSSVKAKFVRLTDNGDEESAIPAEVQEKIPWHHGLEDNLSCLPSMTFKQRLWGFLICLAIGIALSWISVAFVGKADKFAICYTIGNVVAIVASCFLVGPVRQFKLMFAPTRFVAAIIFFTMMGLTLWVAIDLKKTGLCIIFLVLQTLSLIWYGFSFVPYLRTMILNWVTCGKYSEWVKACGCGKKKSQSNST